MLKIGIIGAGSISKSHITAYQKNANCKVVAISDLNEELANEKAKIFGIEWGAENGNKIKNVAYLRYELYKYKIGETIKVKVLRDNNIKEISIELT